MNRTRRPLLCTLLPLALLAGCAAPDRPRVADSAQCPPPAARALDTDELLHYHACLATLSPAQLAREYDAVKRASAQGGDSSQRIRLALLLARPEAPFHSLPQALQLLTPAPGARADGMQDLAALLRAALAEQLRLEDRSQDLEKQLATERAHADSLQDKIDSIKELERNLTQKEMP